MAPIFRANAMLTADGVEIATTRGATRAFHEFVRVGNRVFDTMTGPNEPAGALSP